MTTATTVPAHLRDWPTRALSFVVCVLGPLLTGTISYLGWDPAIRVNTSWAILGSFTMGVSALWREAGRPRDPLFWWGLVGMGGLTALLSMVFRVEPTRALWISMVQLLCAVVIVWLLRVWFRRVQVVPATTEEVLVSVLAIAIGSALAALLGGYPAQWGSSWSPQMVVWWGSRFFVGTVCSVLPVSLLVCWRGAGVPLVTRWLHAPLLLLACGAGPLLAFRLHNLSLTWVLLVVAMWAGIVLSPLAAAFFTLVLASSIGAIGSHYMSASGYNHEVTTSVVIDLLTTSCGVLAITIAMYRDQATRLQARSRQQSALLSAVFQSVADGIALVSPQSAVELHNRPFVDMLGTPPAQLSADAWVEHFDIRVEDGSRPLSADETRQLLDRSIAPRPMQVLLAATPTRPERVVDLTTQWVDTDTGERLMVLLHDVTADRRRQAELTHFARTVAHDLRTPLTGIQGWLELAHEAIEDADEQMTGEAIRRAATATRRTTQVIEDWLAYAVTHDGALHPTEVSLAEVADIVVDPVGLGTLPDDSEIVVRAPHLVLADRGLVIRVLTNLVSNSVKYARPGRPVHIDITSRAIDDGWVEIEVADHGLGFEPADEERVFGEFVRGNRDKGYRPGTGLGLSLCRSIVLRHGGDIHAERNPYGGATVVFTLPAAP